MCMLGRGGKCVCVGVGGVCVCVGVCSFVLKVSSVISSVAYVTVALQID